MEYLIGVMSTIIIIALARIATFERDRSFYPIVLIVIGFLYVLFAAIDGRTEVVFVESVFALVFTAVALFGFKKSEKVVGFGIMMHGFFDISHHLFIQNNGVPIFWAGFCLSIDFLLGLYVIFMKDGVSK
jgi:hypothetical protein